MARKSVSKFVCDSSLFKPEPPVDARLVKQLFAGRDKELQRGYDTLRHQLDLDGKRSRHFDKKPWVIHGESRSGKSHLARRILAEFRPHPKRLQLLVSARERLEAILVMADLFRQLVGHFRRLTLDQRFDDPVADVPDVRLVDQLIERMDLFLNEAQTATVTREQGEEATLEIGGELSGLLGKLLGRYQVKDAAKESRQIVLKAPTAQTLAEVCGVLVETLLKHQLLQHLLVLFDDVDLLDYSAPSPQQARVQRNLLMEALGTLHGQAGVDVILTARSWLVYSSKDLTTLVDLAESTLSAETLVAIHNKHLNQFARKAGIQSFLTPQALKLFSEEMQNDLDGLPGVFLQHLYTAFDRFKDDDDYAERDYEWFIGVFRRLVDRLRSRCEPAAKAVQEAVWAGHEVINVGELNPFIGTAFDNLLVFQSYHNERCYFTSPVLRKIFQKPITEPGTEV